jgi:hypothetical protein
MRTEMDSPCPVQFSVFLFFNITLKHSFLPFLGDFGCFSPIFKNLNIFCLSNKTNFRLEGKKEMSEDLARRESERLRQASEDFALCFIKRTIRQMLYAMYSTPEDFAPRAVGCRPCLGDGTRNNRDNAGSGGDVRHPQVVPGADPTQSDCSRCWHGPSDLKSGFGPHCVWCGMAIRGKVTDMPCENCMLADSDLRRECRLRNQGVGGHLQYPRNTAVSDIASPNFYAILANLPEE